VSATDNPAEIVRTRYYYDTAACSIQELKGEGTVTETLTAKNDPINY